MTRYALLTLALSSLVVVAACDSSDPGGGGDDARADVGRRDGVGQDVSIDSRQLSDATIDGLFSDLPGDAADGGVDAPADATSDAIAADGVDAVTSDASDGAVETTSADSSADTVSPDTSVDTLASDTSADFSVDITVSVAGCSDGDREGFTNAATHPNIAGCSGGWSVPGVLSVKAPACNRVAGNSSSNPTGNGCAAEDLCAVGWHICADPAEVAAKSSTGCTGSAAAGTSLFFATRQSGPANGICGAGANDIFGCGTLGIAPAASCSPLDRFSNNLCGALGAPWSCGSDGFQEANNVVKTAAAGGGVLCCR
ncbi:MAG: hypothetical protein KC503_20940 [Myxococcales bacterium]|nr:hypothetical protein [Myxococcales bacterium]